MRLSLHPLSLALLSCVFSVSSTFALTFAEWQTTKFRSGELADPAISGPNADPDGDGRQNLLEYAFGVDPLASDQDESSLAVGPNGPTLTYPEVVLATDLLYHLAESSDLMHWITPNATTRTVLADDGPLRLVSIFNPNAPAAPLKWFNRLHVLITPDGTESLAAPTHADAKLDIPFKVNVGWNDNTKIEDGFAVERRVGAGGLWQEIGTTHADINTFEDIHIVGSTEYTYRVRAIQGDYASEESNEFSLTTPLDTDQDGIPDDREAAWGVDPLAFSTGNNGIPDGWWISYGMDPFSDPDADPDGDGRSNFQEFLDGTNPTIADFDPNPSASPPLAPSDLELTTLDNGSNELSWTNIEAAEGILIERSGDGATWQTVGMVSGTKTTFTDATAEPDSVLFYRVVAFN